MTKHLKITLLGFLFSFVVLFIASPILSEFKEIPKKEKRLSDKGLYVTYTTTLLEQRFSIIKQQAKEAGLNTIVVDVKYPIGEQLLPLLKQKTLDDKIVVIPDKWLSKLTASLHEEGFIVAGRIVAFKDDHLAIERPDLAIKTENGNLYRDNQGGRWVNPYLKEVRLYNELLAEIAAKSGIDEVEFDYIRFPAEGAANTISAEDENLSRVEVINLFLKETKNRISKYNVSLAVDIFGVTAWQSKFDIQTLGQSIEAMADNIDVLCPMLYPSHFHAGYDGYAFPGNEPYYFINTGVKKAKEMLKGKNVKLVPWIQGFAWGTTIFSRNYIEQQIKACQDEGVDSFLIWNAGNRYDQIPNTRGPVPTLSTK